MHQLTNKITGVVPIQRCDQDKVDQCIEGYMKDRLKWLEDGDTSLKRIREAFGIGDKNIKENKIMCNICKDVIVSEYRHDYKSCKCGTVSVDGGNAYLRRGYKKAGDYEELSTYSE